MKKLLAIILLISTVCLSSCNLFHRSIIIEKTDECVKITLDNFEGKKKIKMKHESHIGYSLYYSTNITSGSVSASYKESWLFGPYELFTADANTNIKDAVGYIDSAILKITVIIEAEEATSGTLLFSFSPIE